MRSAAHCPNQDDHPAIQESDRDKPILAIIAAVVFDRQRGAGENFARPRHVEASMIESSEALGSIELDRH